MQECMQIFTNTHTRAQTYIHANWERGKNEDFAHIVERVLGEWGWRENVCSAPRVQKQRTLLYCCGH